MYLREIQSNIYSTININKHQIFWDHLKVQITAIEFMSILQRVGKHSTQFKINTLFYDNGNWGTTGANLAGLVWAVLTDTEVTSKWGKFFLILTSKAKVR